MSSSPSPSKRVARAWRSKGCPVAKFDVLKGLSCGEKKRSKKTAGHAVIRSSNM